MKYRLKTAGNFYSKEKEQHIEKLKRLGFSFGAETKHGYPINDGDVHIEIKTLDDIDRLMKDVGEIIIDSNGTITIFDDYLD